MLSTAKNPVIAIAITQVEPIISSPRSSSAPEKNLINATVKKPDLIVSSNRKLVKNNIQIPMSGILSALRRMIDVIIPTPDIIPLPARERIYLLFNFVKIELNFTLITDMVPFNGNVFYLSNSILCETGEGVEFIVNNYFLMETCSFRQLNQGFPYQHWCQIFWRNIYLY